MVDVLTHLFSFLEPVVPRLAWTWVRESRTTTAILLKKFWSSFSTSSKLKQFEGHSHLNNLIQLLDGFSWDAGEAWRHLLHRRLK